ncbi:hypothetical protein C2S52_020396 [Perilla frutescens var. hirtella]|nr:hypothetical protein C2S52_020396 [Perilla frutescens var. hirtella]KAH6805441.1 hypothetical protein C2S51_030272 [Perilla frutescens var. frutescens]
MSGNDTNVEKLKPSEDNVAYDVPSMPSEWLVNGNAISNKSWRRISVANSVVEVSSGPSASMVDYSCPPIWGDQSVDEHGLEYCSMNVKSDANPSTSFSGLRDGVNWTPNAMLREGVFMPTISRMLPDSLLPFSSDSTGSAFLERAASLPWFSGGTLSETFNPFSFPPNPLKPCSRGNRPMQGEHSVFIGDGLTEVSKEASLSGKHETEWSSFKNEKESRSFMGSHDEAKTGVDVSANQCDEVEFSGLDAQQNLVGISAESSVKGLGLKKRKRTKQKPENHHENNEALQSDVEKANKTAEIRQKGEQSPSSMSNLGGKQETERSDPPEEGYIHVRARSGQATNSHSLAERVRREKISERMKHLQDLVPGCSKVTGKAVMLDEIINYVQSLQQQVELATVNPPLEVNMGGFLAKDILQPGAGMSYLLDFPPDKTMHFPPMHLPQSELHQAGLPVKRNSSEAPDMPVCLESTVVCGGLSEPTSQEPGLHNAIHNGLNSSAPLTTQDIISSHSDVEVESRQPVMDRDCSKN